MHDPRALLSSDTAAAHLARRGYRLDTAAVDHLVRERSRLTTERDTLRTAARSSTRQRGQGAHENAAAGRDLRSQIHDTESELKEVEQLLKDLLLAIPNLPLDEAPSGSPADPAVEICQWGTPTEFDFAPRDHVTLGTSMGILDLERAGKISGARFAIASGAGARLERALAAFFLDLHTQQHGYRELSLPHLVNRETMTATGQLPKFSDDLFATQVADRELFLIPTAEVPLVNLFRGEILPAAELPVAVTAHTACFRSEAGSYGRDTRGIIRLHEFAKVELVRICAPEDAEAQHEVILAHAETCLQNLGLHYRVVDLRAGDLGFSAQRTYDLEVWLPSQGCFREISSVSNCGTFQGRRAGIKVRKGGTKEFAATLNGSGLPVGRTVVALLEQFQQGDGSVAIPAALVPYTGFELITSDGSTK